MVYRASAKGRQPALRRRGYPITALSKDYPTGSHVPRHHHQRGQLIHAVSGVAQITTREGIWILPPQRALWVPPRMAHEVRIESTLAARTLYLDREASASLGMRCKILFMSTLLRELVLEVVRGYEQRDRSERMELVTRLLLCELQNAEQRAIHVPAPSDSRLKKVCKQLLDNPSRQERLDWLADAAGASSRTLARLFQRELHMTFVKWRQHVRLVRALSQIALGDPMKKVARDNGYRSCSAFSAMFREALGSAPTRYLQQSSRSDTPGGRTR